MIDMTVALGVVMGISELLKRVWGLNSKYIPLVNLFFSILFFIFYGSFDLKTDLLNGLIMGLSASGLYSGVKNVGEAVFELING